MPYERGFASYFGAVWTPTQPIVEVNKYEYGLYPTETEVNNLFRSEDWNLVHQTL